jgi:transcriptional regulator PpsR
VLALLEASCDLVALVDPSGAVWHLRAATPALAATLLAHGASEPGAVSLAACVEPDSLAKVAALLADPAAGRAREINLKPAPNSAPDSAPDSTQAPVPVRALLREAGGALVLTARDLSALAQGQKELAEASLAAARDLDEARQSQLRLRRQMQASPAAQLLVDLGARRIVEANPAATRLIGADPAGWSLARLVADEAALEALLAGSSDEAVAALGDGPPVRIALGRLREGRRMLGVAVLVPLEPGAGPAGGAEAAWGASAPAAGWQEAPVAQLVLDGQLRITHLNEAALDLAQAERPRALLGRGLGELIGRSGADAQVLGANLREHGRVNGFASALRTGPGALEPVEISARRLGDGAGFVVALRPLPPRAAAESPATGDRTGAARSPMAMVELIGRMPLKDIVRESADLIEQLCIEAALELTGGNRANAAELLGLSRQSLYTKLHKLGLFAAGDADDEQGADSDSSGAP